MDPSRDARQQATKPGALQEGTPAMKKIATIGTLVAATTLVALSACTEGNGASNATGPAAAPAAKTAAPATAAAAPATATEAPATLTAEEKPPATPEYTVAQQNAIQSAESYLEMSGFSRAGLIEQLSSEYGEGYVMADAVFAVDHLEVDWNAEAAESAESYLEMSGFSRAGLIEQLSSEYGDQFTLAQATYAANHVGL
jgi:hypothetical protein